MNYAIIEQGKVTNITLWDGVSAWTPAAGEAVACPENVGILGAWMIVPLALLSWSPFIVWWANA